LGLGAKSSTNAADPGSPTAGHASVLLRKKRLGTIRMGSPALYGILRIMTSGSLSLSVALSLSH
jgi:hypothetical protein